MRTDMTKNDVGATLRRLAVPMMLGMLSFMVFNLADTLFVAQLGSEQLAAMAFTFPVVFIVMSLSAGLGAGGSAVISRAATHGTKRMEAWFTDIVCHFPVMSCGATA